MMITQKEIKTLKKSISIPGNIIRFSVGVSILFLLFFLYTANMTGVKAINTTITSVILVIVISWVEKSESIQDNVIKQLVRTKGKSNVFMLKRKLNLNSLFLSAAITAGFCFSDSLPLNIKLILIIVLSSMLVVKIYTGMICNYRTKMLITENLNKQS